MAAIVLGWLMVKPSGAKVWHRERAKGVRPELQAFLDWWEQNGAFPITVVEHGGVRYDQAEQAALFARGATKAATLADTPHGHAGALDLAPYDEKKRAPMWSGADHLFAAIGAAAKARGLKWGGDWQSFKDLPHVELPNWRSLPMPTGGVA